nr:MAG TPA: hypothetical protein [Caudoviricetes sp.]
MFDFDAWPVCRIWAGNLEGLKMKAAQGKNE